MAPHSISGIRLIIEISGRTRAVCILKRHLAPRTVGIISRSLPLDGRIHRMGDSILYISTAVDSGMERARTEFKKGDVAFLPSAGGLCFFTGNAESNRMTLIGRLEGEIGPVSAGDVARIYSETA